MANARAVKLLSVRLATRCNLAEKMLTPRGLCSRDCLPTLMILLNASGRMVPAEMIPSLEIAGDNVKDRGKEGFWIAASLIATFY